MEVGLYARVSSEEQAQGEKASIDQQLAEMRALCERRGWSVAGEFVDCKDYKATQNPRKGKIVNPSGERADRPAFVELLDLLKMGALGGLVCWRDDRLVRHPRVAVVLEDALDIGDAQSNGKGKIQVFDATGATIDRFTLSIKATIWREENKRRVERVRMGKVATLQAGRWPATYDRLGYTTKSERGRRGCEIVLVEEEAQVVQQIFDLYDAGMGVKDIRDRLIASGAVQKGKHTSNRQKREWSMPVIYNVLRSESYTGRLTYHFADGVEYTIEIPQIIEPDQYERVQARMARNKTTSKRNAKWVYLLQGILECGECGGKILAQGVHHAYAELEDGTRKRYPVDPPRHQYICAAAKLFARDNDHPRPYLFNGRPLDWDVWRYIVDNGIKRPDHIRLQVLARQEELQRQGDGVDGDVAHARRRLAEVDEERAFYQRQAARGKMTEREFDTRMDETEDARRYWQGELDRLKELRDNAVKVQNGLEYATELLTSLQARLTEIDQTPEELAALPKEQQESILQERQDIIRALCEKVIVWSDRRVKLVGVIDGSEAAQFDLKRPRWYNAPQLEARSLPTGWTLRAF